MPIRVHRDHKRRWFIAKASGSLTIAAMLRFLRTVRAAEPDRRWPLLFDARSATTAATDADLDRAVAVIAEAMTVEGPRGHVAIVAPDDALHDWLLRYEARCAAIGVRVIRVFRLYDDAERWLQLVSDARYFR